MPHALRLTRAALGLLIATTALAQPSTRGARIDPQANALLERADRGRMQGDANAPIWIVEVADFQCSFCKMWHDSSYADIRREFIATGVARLAFVNYPVEGHAHALVAAEAGMCAAAQDRFWPLHDRIFATQRRWSPMERHDRVVALLDSLARASGVGMPEWRSCMASGTTRRLIEADRDRALRAGVSGTPHFFIGDEAISGAAPTEAFRAAIARARAKAAAAARQP